MEPAREDIPAAILWADIRSPEFKAHHEILREYAAAGRISYRVRHRPALTREERPVMLSGYGVELALKKTDYIVMDDREVASESEAATKKTAGEAAEALDNDESQDITPLQQKDITFLGIKATSFVMASSDPLSTLLKLTQDFPKHSNRVAATESNLAITEELRHNWEVFPMAGQNTIWINGFQVEESQVNAFALLENLRGERKNIRQLMELGLTSREVVELLSHQVIADSKQAELPQRFDYRDTTEGGGVIIWLNDLENDMRYREWSPSVSTVCVSSTTTIPTQVEVSLLNLRHDSSSAVSTPASSTPSARTSTTSPFPSTSPPVTTSSLSPTSSVSLSTARSESALVWSQSLKPPTPSPRPRCFSTSKTPMASTQL